MDADGKHFDKWIELKGNLHSMNRLRTIHEGEIWWCAMGENIGVEINGKSKTFARPVLIFKKLSRFGFLGIPLTSQPHEGNWYTQFTFQDKQSPVNLSCWGWAGGVPNMSSLYQNLYKSQ